MLRRHAPHFAAGLIAVAAACSFGAAVATAAGRTPSGAAAPLPASLVVKTGSGAVRGTPGADPVIRVFKGIPYAAAPVGPLRWKPPVPAAPWQGVRAADKPGNVCPQPATPQMRGYTMSEDCLNLNVWTAAHPGQKQPVLVWIYGGGFIEGTGADPQFNGETLARKGVVVVTFNYRTGVLGFLATKELSRESGHNASGNYGLLDDVAALKWVRANIAAFGGDPARVTIAGQSAGAGSVGFMAMSPLARGLFRAGIAESHSRWPSDPDLRFLSVSHRTLANAEASGEAYAKAHGATALADLRAMPWQTLIEGSAVPDMAVDTGTTAKPPLFRPVIDGWVLPRNYSQSLAARAQNKVTIVTGNNSDETGAIPATAIAPLRAANALTRAGAPQIVLTVAGYETFARGKFGKMADEFLRLYPGRTDDEAALAASEAARDNNRITTWLWAGEWIKGTRLPVYNYFWTKAPPGPDAHIRGAYHGAEIPYALGNLQPASRPWTDEDRAVADRASSYWANFIKTGNPNGPGLPVWRKFDPAVPQAMELGHKWAPIPLASSPEKIQFWRRFYATQQAW
jgi:para-nitrobenzyl esterase